MMQPNLVITDEGPIWTMSSQTEIHERKMSDSTELDPVDSSDAEEVIGQLTASLNRHGYAFQHAVLKRARELFESHKRLVFRRD